MLGLIVVTAFVFYFLVRPFLRPINPFFAAQRVEDTVPDAKNSVINWLDLHDEPLPEATKTQPLAVCVFSCTVVESEPFTVEAPFTSGLLTLGSFA